MPVLSDHYAARLKLRILSEGVFFDSAFLEHFARDSRSMEKRRVYNDSDERHLSRTLRIPQEMYIKNVVVAVNYKQHSPWQIVHREGFYRLIGKDGTDVEVTFTERPLFLEEVTPKGVRC